MFADCSFSCSEESLSVSEDDGTLADDKHTVTGNKSDTARNINMNGLGSEFTLMS